MICAAVNSTFLEAGAQFRPPPKLSMTEWAERYFVLSSEDSAEQGRYRSTRAPYQREILDSIQDPLVEDIVLQTAAQTVKTTAIKIWLAYFIKEDPASILFLLPGLDAAKRVSRQRLAPMFRDVPVLRGLLEEGARKASNTTLEKTFPGGVLFLVGANSPAGLAGMPIRILMADELNRYPPSAGAEGSPVALAEERTANFWNRKKIKASTPTDSHGAITKEFESTDMRQYHVPCPHCSQAAGQLDGFQVLVFERLIIDKESPHLGTVYACQFCGVAITEQEKDWMLRRGRWIAQHPEILTRRGYHLNALYSPFRPWAKIAEKWQHAMRHREDKNLLKVFITTILALPYDDEGETLESSELMGRREDYPCPAPDGVTVATAGVDVQHDRIELLVRGWGKGQESWLLDKKVFEGDTSVLKYEDPKPGGDVLPVKRETPWQKLDGYLERASYLHARGVRVQIACTFVDSGDQTQTVYEFVKSRAGRWIFAVKGVSGFGRAPLGNFSRNNRAKVRLYPVGVDEIKSTLHHRLRSGTPGAGFLHFSRQFCDEEYFKQLTVEQLKYKMVHGYRIRYWWKPDGERNEALDLEVYAYAAFLRLSDKPEEFLERQRQALLERAKFAALQRRQKTDPNQLALLVPSAAADPLAPGPEPLQTSAEPEPPEDVSLGVDEHKVAAALEVKPETPQPEPSAPAPPRPRRPSRWQI